MRDWLQGNPTPDVLADVFKELSVKDKGAAKLVRERLDEVKRAKGQDALVGEWSAKAQTLLDMERNPTAEGRDDVRGADDLAFRAVRGGSFFSIDPDASWHPAYRLCDPPFASYFDLGFRIAVYPPQERAT